MLTEATQLFRLEQLLFCIFAHAYNSVIFKMLTLKNNIKSLILSGPQFICRGEMKSCDMLS